MCASHRQIGLIITISRKTYVTDGDVSYKLVRTGNIPIADESMIEYSILEKGAAQLNFILEFEQFPLDGPFDIMDDVSDGNSLEFTDIKVDTQSMREVDQDRFGTL